MIKLYDNGVYLLNGTEIVEDGAQALDAVLAKTGRKVTKEEAAKGTMAYGILEAHNTHMCKEIWRNVCTTSSGCYSSVCERNACRWRKDASWF